MAPDSKVRSRMKKDLVIWLTTVGADGRPHAVLVWFYWDGESFLVYSVPGQKVDDIKANPNVVLHLNSDPDGGNVVRITGTAKIVRSQPPASQVPAYIRKYRGLIKGYEWTPTSFSEQYNVPIRIRPAKFH